MTSPAPALSQGDTAWFVRDRFGMFIHWGLYAAPARQEWIMNMEEIAPETYENYFRHFDPDLFDAADWARQARAAGMKYVVITTKHHEGFCLWDSAYTDYKATNAPCKRDLLREIVDAFRAEGLKIGFYHSLIDWHHPHFPIDAIHPLRNHPDVAKLNATRDVAVYREYLHNQVRELLTGFGPISVIWYDFSYPQMTHNGLGGKGREDWGSEALLEMTRALQPGILVNNRLDLATQGVDFHTPEQVQPHKCLTINGEAVCWEACHTFSWSWGYHRGEDTTWKSAEQLVKLLIDSVSCGGNLLMNVGPTARGEFDPRAQAALRAYADWMRLHNRAIYGCTQSEFEAPRDCRLTQSGNRLYVHVYSWPFRQLVLKGLAGKVAYAHLLNDASEVLAVKTDAVDVHSAIDPQVGPGDLILDLPVRKPDAVVPVLELFLT